MLRLDLSGMGRLGEALAQVEACRKIAPYDFSGTLAPRKRESTHRRYDVSRLTRQVPGFAFTDFDTGLRATLEFFSRSTGSK